MMTAEPKIDYTDIEYDMQRCIYNYFKLIWKSGRNVANDIDRQILTKDLQAVLDEDMARLARTYGPEYTAEYLQQHPFHICVCKQRRAINHVKFAGIRLIVDASHPEDKICPRIILEDVVLQEETPAGRYMYDAEELAAYAELRVTRDSVQPARCAAELKHDTSLCGSSRCSSCERPL